MNIIILIILICLIVTYIKDVENNCEKYKDTHNKNNKCISLRIENIDDVDKHAKNHTSINDESINNVDEQTNPIQYNKSYNDRGIERVKLEIDKTEYRHENNKYINEVHSMKINESTKSYITDDVFFNNCQDERIENICDNNEDDNFELTPNNIKCNEECNGNFNCCTYVKNCRLR